jgi:hypothetical protein
MLAGLDISRDVRVDRFANCSAVRTATLIYSLNLKTLDGRPIVGRLAKLGFTPGEAEALSSLHTRNFM